MSERAGGSAVERDVEAFVVNGRVGKTVLVGESACL